MGRRQLRDISGEDNDQSSRPSNRPLDLSHVVSDGPPSLLGGMVDLQWSNQARGTDG